MKQSHQINVPAEKKGKQLKRTHWSGYFRTVEHKSEWAPGGEGIYGMQVISNRRGRSTVALVKTPWPRPAEACFWVGMYECIRHKALADALTN